MQSLQQLLTFYRPMLQPGGADVSLFSNKLGGKGCWVQLAGSSTGEEM